MKVGVVCPYDLLLPGGVQQLCIELADRLRRGGDDSVVVGPGNPDKEAPQGSIAVGGAVGIRANDSVAPVTITPAAWRRMRRALADVDVVHIHEPLVPLAGWAALSVDKPKVLTFHADAPDWVAAAYRSTPWLSRAVEGSVLTAVSPSAGRSIPARWGNLRIIPNAVDVAAYRVNVERDPLQVAFLGRDEPRKGLDTALEAFSEVRTAHPGASLVVMGANRPGPTPPGVDFRGFVADREKRTLLASSAVFVAPNTGGESFGIVLAEAMAAGCAVVASDLESFRPVVGDDGILVPVGDSGALAEAVGGLLADPQRCRSMGEAARRRVARFDWDQILDEYRSAYQDAMGGR